LNVSHHFLDIIIAVGVEDFAIAKAAHAALRVRIYPQNRHVSILNHARRLQEGAIAS